MKKHAQAWEPIPELLRPQNCAGYVTPSQANPSELVGTVTVTEMPCPIPAEWYSTATGTPACEEHKRILEGIRVAREITPP